MKDQPKKQVQPAPAEMQGQAAPAGMIVTWPKLLTALGAIALPAIYFAVYIGSLGSDVKGLRHDVDMSAGRIDDIWKALPSLRASAASEHPTNPANQKAAKELLAEARQKTIPPIPVPFVAQAGQSFIEASPKDPLAWDVALDFLSYRSWLNPILAAPSGVVQESTRYEPRRVTSGPAPELFETKNTGVPIAEAARLEAIGKNLNPGVKTGPRLLILRRGATSLDGMYLRNIILDNREVYYTGQPLILENVIFSNCKFVLGNDIRGRQLAGSILTSPSVTFRAG